MRIHRTRCACGEVEMEALGEPILAAECFCRSCQKGGKQIAALPDAHSPLRADGGTSMVLFRNDRVRCARGQARLTRFKLKPHSPSSRVVATCCNSGMQMEFDKGPHWVSMYRDRFVTDVPPPKGRMWTSTRPEGVQLDDAVPNYEKFMALSFMGPLLWSMVQMKLRPERRFRAAP